MEPLARLEAGLLTFDAPLASWEDVFARGIPARQIALATDLTARLAAGGVIERPTPGAVLDAAAADPYLGRVIVAGQPDEETARDATRQLVGLIARAGAAAEPGVRALVSWDSPAPLVGPDGREIAVAERVDQASASGAYGPLAGELRQRYSWLERPVDVAALTARPRGPLGALTMVRPPWTLTWQNLIVHSDGLVVVPRAFANKARGEHGRDLRELLARPWEEVISDPSNRWIPGDAIARAKVTQAQYGPALKLWLTDGSTARWLTGPMTEVFDDPMGGLRQLLGDRLE